MVMLLKPTVPVSPVTVKEIVVDFCASSVANVTFEICEEVMFPLIVRLTVLPLSVLAFKVAVDDSKEAGDVEAVDVGAGVDDGVGSEDQKRRR